MIVTVSDPAQFSNPHQSPMISCELSCKHLMSILFTHNEAQQSNHGAAFLFGIFSLQGLQEFIAMHEAKAIALEVCYTVCNPLGIKCNGYHGPPGCSRE